MKITSGLLVIAFSICGAGATASGAELPNYGDQGLFCASAVEQGLVHSHKICMRREQRARAILHARWQSYPERKRAQCLRDGAVAMMGASYDGLLWCLRRAAR